MKASMSHAELRTFRSAPRRRPAASVSLSTKLNHLWQKAIAYFTASSEPHIWKSEDAAGNVEWHAYDPVNRETVRYSSEEEMRVWLEERHYRYGVSAS